MCHETVEFSARNASYPRAIMGAGHVPSWAKINKTRVPSWA